MILFLSDRDDPIFYAAYDYFSSFYKCQYNEKNDDAELIITNHYITSKKKIIYYGTDPFDNFSNINNRRVLINWFKDCASVVCSSVFLGKCFYDAYRIRPVIQYPYTLERNVHPEYIFYRDFEDIDFLKNTLSENFVELIDAKDISKAKIYLCGSRGMLDLGLCYATTYGIPVLMYDNIALREFLENSDTILSKGLPLLTKTQYVKRALKEHNRMKEKSKKYSQLPILKDKIDQALARKPSMAQFPFQSQKMAKIQGRRSRGRQQNHHQPMYVKPKIVPPLTDKTIYVTGSVVSISGYDNFVYEIIRGLRSVNVDVRINSRGSINPEVCPPYFSEIFMDRPGDAWEIIIMPPCNIDRWSPTKKSIVYTMWETDYLKPFWVKQLNLSAFIIVPSQWAVDCFKKCGVTVPIYKIPLGYDPLVFNPAPNWPNVLTFGTAAALAAGGIRKNTEKVIDLFRQTFTEKDVKLKVKVTAGCKLPEYNDPRIEIIRGFLPPGELANWYKSIHTFISASNAEGFGLHLIETMACGRPIISTKYSAVTEYFDDSVGWVIDHKITSASGGAYEGHWGEPIGESIKHAMRHVYSHREEIPIKGNQAFLKARNFTWKNTGKALLELLHNKGIVK